MNWAANKLKLQRAIQKAKLETAEPDEEMIKEWYIKLGGLVLKEGKKNAKTSPKTVQE